MNGTVMFEGRSDHMTTVGTVSHVPVALIWFAGRAFSSHI